MNRLRVTSAGIAAGHITPHWFGLASASEARMHAFMSSVYMISSPMRSSAWGRWALPSVSVIRSATPSTNSHLARFLAAPWCAVWVGVSRQSRGVHGDLVRQRSERGQDPGAAHHHAGVGLADDPERSAFLQVEHARDVPAPL